MTAYTDRQFESDASQPTPDRVAARLDRAATAFMGVEQTDPGLYRVDSGSGESYDVDVASGMCTCPDAESRGPWCKHAFAVLFQTGAVPSVGAEPGARDDDADAVTDGGTPPAYYEDGQALADMQRDQQREPDDANGAPNAGGALTPAMLGGTPVGGPGGDAACDSCNRRLTDGQRPGDREEQDADTVHAYATRVRGTNQWMLRWVNWTACGPVGDGDITEAGEAHATATLAFDAQRDAFVLANPELLPDGDHRPDDCDCWDPTGDLPCWPCYRDGFESPNSDAGDES